MTCLRVVTQRSRHGNAKAPVKYAGRHFPRGGRRAVSDGIRDEDSGPDLGDDPVSEDERRSMPPFGSPKGEGQHEKSRRNTGGVARSQVDPHHGTDAPVYRQGRWRDQSPLRLQRPNDGPASVATIPPLAPLREARLNGFPAARAVMPRHRNAGRRRRVPDTPPPSLSDASYEGKPAYPRYNRGAGEGRCPFDPQQTRAPMDCAGGGVAPVPPVTAHRDG